MLPPAPVGVATINRKFARSRVHNWEGANPEIISLVSTKMIIQSSWIYKEGWDGRSEGKDPPHNFEIYYNYVEL